MRKTMFLAVAIAITAGLLRAERLANGLEFRAPEGWSVKSNNVAAVLMPPDAAMEPGGKEPAELYIVAMLPGVTSSQDPQLASVLKNDFFPAASQIRAAGTPQAFRAAGGSGHLHRFDTVSQGIAMRLQLYAVGLPAGGVAALLAVGHPAMVLRREATLALVAVSLAGQPPASPAATPPAAPATAPAAPATVAPRPAAGGPLVAQWEQRLRGRKLYQFNSYSSSYGSGGSNSQRTLLLSTNGTYQFHRSSSVSIYVDGANGGSSSQGADQGRWRIYEQAGKAILELVSSNGTPEQITLTTDGSKTLLNGRRWLVGD